MSKNPATHYEASIASHATEHDGGSSLRAEQLRPTHLELSFPTPAQYDTFDTILRCDAAAPDDLRLVDPGLARDILLDRLNRARNIRARANTFNPHDAISEAQLCDAYFDGADAYAGLITLAPPLNNGNAGAMDAFYEWSRLANNAATQIEGRGGAPGKTIARTPASLAGDAPALASMRDTLTRRAQFERIAQYWDAAQNRDSTAVREAFVGGDASQLDRAKALFTYAHSLPEDATALKIACLEESVVVIHDAVTHNERPHDDDLVGIYEYFMLQSMLGRSVHDIVWLDGHDTEDNRVRSLSVQYLTNAADALSYVRDHLITAQEEYESVLWTDSLAFNARVEQDETSNAARATIDFLVTGFKELRTAEAALRDITNYLHDYPTKAAELDVAQKRVAYLTAKAKYEGLEQKIIEQKAIRQRRIDAIRAEYQHLADRLLAQRSRHIGSILPNTDGHRLAELVLNIDQHINEARSFAHLYDAECKADARHSYDAQQMGLSVMRLLQTLEEIRPDDESMNASPFRSRTPVMHQ